MKLPCPSCGFDLTDVLVCHPRGFVGGVAAAVLAGAPCCGHHPSVAEVKEWARIANEAHEWPLADTATQENRHG